MTQDATTPLDNLRATLAAKLGGMPWNGTSSPLPICSDEELAAARQSLIADGINPDAKVTFDENGNAPMGADAFLKTPGATIRKDGSASFYSALDHLEAEGSALLQTVETHVEDVGHTILAIGEHTMRPAAAAPHLLHQAQALPLARAGDILHESEHAIVRAFMDAENVLRRVYLNIHGLWVKA